MLLSKDFKISIKLYHNSLYLENWKTFSLKNVQVNPLNVLKLI